jgi:hypothetical protein
MQTNPNKSFQQNALLMLRLNIVLDSTLNVLFKSITKVSAE